MSEIIIDRCVHACDVGACECLAIGEATSNDPGGGVVSPDPATANILFGSLALNFLANH